MRSTAVAAGAEVRYGERVTDIEVRRHDVVVHGMHDEFVARLAIDAAGRNSPAVRRLGLRAPEPEVNQIGVAQFFTHFDDTPLHTWDRHFYGRHGAMISGSRTRPGSYRYVLEADWADKQLANEQPAQFFADMARRHDPWLAERLGRETAVRVWSMAPIGYRVSELVHDRLVLVGDAAGYLSPITGQGIEFALRSSRLAAECADKALLDGDLSRAAFTPYVDGHSTEVAAQVAVLRAFLALLRDEALLRRAAHDRDALRALLGGMADLPGEEWGTL
jgi:flavin-dependent dehydrogenase